MQLKEFKVLVIYDISDNKRRAALAKQLNSYGFRVQRSAFEMFLTTEKIKVLLNKIPFMIKEAQDNVRIYEFRNRCIVHQFGMVDLPVYEDIIII